ncbi:Coat F domain protein [Paenibacillus konkukensis]|uniref:Coat F domain protein n=1 Tax=Paenibacillus konkukensis TaxID=2020716 RepID=A0ABY4RRH7_9BACL|nr:spore coat protein [Paenibacillus konkukensis]UQZ84319.1 Coat F domain protein [Paenibacillus konkukensis]
MYQQNYSSQPLHQHTPLQEQDWGNLVLAELKRAAREYTTAALEATHPAIRQTFQSLAQRTMQDQAELFTVLSQMHGYGSVKMAQQQEIQQDLQQQIQKVEQLQSLVQRSIQQANAGAGVYQQAAQTSYQAYPQYQQQPVYASYEQPSGFSGSQTGGSLTGSTASQSQQQTSAYGQSYGAGYNAQGYYGSQSGQGQSQGASYSSASHPGQSQHYSFASAGGASDGFNMNQSSTSQSIANELTGSIRSASNAQDYSASNRAGQDSFSSGKSAGGLGGFASYSGAQATSSRGGNSFDWTDDNDGGSASASALGAANRGGNSYNWTADDNNGASSGLNSTR